MLFSQFMLGLLLYIVKGEVMTSRVISMIRCRGRNRWHELVKSVVSYYLKHLELPLV